MNENNRGIAQRVDELQRDIGQLQLSLDGLLGEFRKRARSVLPLALGGVAAVLVLIHFSLRIYLAIKEKRLN